MDRALYFDNPSFFPLFEIYFFVVGLVIGSFLNVCIHRIPIHKSIVASRSRCPRCDALIPWYRNVPLLSYLWLRGKCANCKERISPVYPIVELITGILLLLLYFNFGISIPFLIYGLFGCITIVLTVIDYHHRLLPAKLTFPGIALGVASSFVNPFLTPLESLVGVVVGGLVPLFALIVYKLVRKREGLGHGDVVMLAMVGAYLGWQQVLLVLFFSSLLGSLIGGLFILVFRKGSDYLLPYGTFIGAAALPAIFWGEQVWHLYVGG